jgi:2-keto-4-pentenoate hydratase/2-oxohepta-3-ene-1,7-dioic acid hydratase in catechol pathway
MKIYRIFHLNKARWAIEKEPNLLSILTSAPYETIETTEETLPLSQAKLLAPAEPSKIVAIGRNYAAHAKELGNDVPSEPLLFLKPPSALCAPNETIQLPQASQRVEHEAELTVVIKKRAKNVSEAHALDFVLGYTCANDVTARDLQKKDVQFTRGKGFDTFCPLGPCIETELNPDDVHVRCLVNNETRQNDTTQHMIFKVKTLIAYVSAVMTLEPGDLILTGTPSGVGPLLSGDSVEVSISGIGTLQNRVM